MFLRFLFCLWRLAGIAYAVHSVSVMEGDSVTLNSNLPGLQTEDLITWTWGSTKSVIAQINKQKITIYSTVYDNVLDGRFRNRLKLDKQTGSLTITDTRTTDSGPYQFFFKGTKTHSTNTFNVTVFARLPLPIVSRNSSQCSSLVSSSSSLSQQNCSLLCSVVNVSHVTLSWFKGHSALSSISVSDLSISLSLSLEVDYQENNTYTCVLNNSFTKQTQHLDITQLCHTCPYQGLPFFYIVLISAGSLLIVVVICCICGERRKTAQTQEEDGTYSQLYKPTTQKTISKTGAECENVP